MKMYDEAGLDAETEYKIVSLPIELENSDAVYIESYATPLERLDELFLSIAKKNSHIDAIILPSLSYAALYTTEKLDKKNDLFIYLGDDDSYAVMYKNGQYISTRGLPTLNELALKFNLDLKTTKDVLKTKGLDKSRYAFDEMYSISVEDELNKLVDRVIQAVVHKSGIFSLNKLDHIFLDFEGSEIPGFFDLFIERGYDESEKVVLDIFPDIEATKKHLAISALYALSALQQNLDFVNLSIYDRKPPFFKTNIGQFSLLLFGSLVLASIYPIYAYMQIQELTTTQNNLTTKLKQIEKITKKLNKKLKSEKSVRDTLKKQNIELRKTIKSYDSMLDTLEFFNKDTLLKQKMLKDIDLALKKYKLSAKSITYNKNHIVVHIVANFNKRDRITQFMEELIHKDYSSVTTTKVEKYENYYESLVEIKR